MLIKEAVINYGNPTKVACDDTTGTMRVTQGKNTVELCDEELMELATLAKIMRWESFERMWDTP